MNQTSRFVRRALLASTAALALSAAPALAQLQSASSSGLGTADAYTARARGFAALGLDPAALGLRSSPRFSLALLPVSVRSGLDPVTMGDLKDFQGKTIPDATKSQWLDRIQAAGGQRVLAGARLTGVALTVGHFGFQASTIGYVHANLTEPVAELLLFGNAGRTGTPADFSLGGSSMDAWAVTTLGISAGVPLHVRIGRYAEQSFAIGATVKYSIGNALLMGREQGGSVSSNPLQVDVEFPILQTDTAFKNLNNGTGVGLDVGAAWEGGPWTAALVVRNLVNTFQWDRSKLFFRPGQALFNQTDKTTNLDAVKAQGAPGAAPLLAQVAGQKFKPVLVAAAARDISSQLTVMGEVENRFGSGMDLGPKSRLAVAAELRAWPFLQVRTGVAEVTGGSQLAAGASFLLGPVDLSGAYLKQWGTEDASFGQITLSFGAR